MITADRDTMDWDKDQMGACLVLATQWERCQEDTPVTLAQENASASDLSLVTTVMSACQSTGVFQMTWMVADRVTATREEQSTTTVIPSQDSVCAGSTCLVGGVIK